MSPAGMPGTAAAETPSVAATSATTPAPAQETTRVLESLPMTPGAPGMPPPQIAAEADRMIIGGAVMLLFAGLAGLTVFMWREVGRRMGTG